MNFSHASLSYVKLAAEILDHSLRARTDMQLSVDAADILTHSVDRNAHQVRDLLVALAVCEVFQRFLLTRGERAQLRPAATLLHEVILHSCCHLARQRQSTL